MNSAIPNPLGNIDHIAIAVLDLEESIEFYTRTLGFRVVERRETQGKTSGMISAVLDAGNINIVLLQGTDPESQITRFIDHYGPGVQHIAFKVEDIERTSEALENNGLQYATTVIDGPGLKQRFTERQDRYGMMFELIERTEESGFSDQNVQQLFNQLEAASAF